MGAEPVLCAGYDLMELRGLGSMLQLGLALFLFYPQLGIHAVAIDYLVGNPPLFHQGKGMDYGEELGPGLPEQAASTAQAFAITSLGNGKTVSFLHDGGFTGILLIFLLFLLGLKKQMSMSQSFCWDDAHYLSIVNILIKL